MLNIPFWCPTCRATRDGELDPAKLLFAPAAMTVTCQDCGSVYGAQVSLETHTVQLGDQIPQEEPDATD